MRGLSLLLLGFSCIFLLAVPAAAAGLVQNINTGVNYTTIQSAVDAATDGDTLVVDSGTYHENVAVSKAVNILGSDTGAGLPRIDGLGSSPLAPAVNGSTFDSLVLVNATGSWEAGIKGSASDLTITNITFEDSFSGIFLADAINVTIRNVNVMGCTYGFLSSGCQDIRVSDSGLTGGSGSLDGITFWGSGNTVTNVVIRNFGDTGIWLSGSQYDTLQTVIISGSSTGISVNESSAYITITGSDISANGNVGILIDGSDNNTVSSTSVHDNSLQGIWVNYADNNTITGSDISANGNQGIWVNGSYNNTISGNTIISNTRGLFITNVSSGNTIYNNYFDNTANVQDSDGSEIWDTTKTTGTNIIGGSYIGGNFWSDYTGVDTDGDGIGNTLLPYNSSIATGGDWLPLTNNTESAPVAKFTASPTSGTAPLDVTFTDTSDVTNGTMWNWSFGDSAWFNATASSNPHHTYSSPGTYSVSLTVTNASASNTTTQAGYISVYSNGSPVASFTASLTSGTAPLSVTFTDSSVITNGTAWNWSFGDSTWFNTTVSSSPMHIYNVPGSYSVSLTVTNASGSNTMTRSRFIVVTSSGGGGGGDTGGSTEPVNPVVPVQQPTVQPSGVSTPQAGIPKGTTAFSQNYPLGFPGLVYNTDGKGQLTINMADAKTAGATVSLYFNRVEVYQHHSPGVKTTFWGDHFTLNNGSTITGPVTRAEFVTDPLNAVLDYGQVSGAVQAVLPSLTHSGWVNNTISQNVSADTLDKFAAATSANALTLRDVAYTLEVKKNGVSTGPANITFTVPAAWVNSHGGKDAVQIARISEDTGTTELIGATYLGLDSKNNMIFQGASPNGTSLFGLVTAEATAVAQKQNPNTTYVAASKPAMITNVGMFEWLLDLVVKNPALLIGIIAVVGLVAYFGWWRRRL